MTGKANFDYRHTYDLQERRDLPDADQKVNLLKTRFAETIPDQRQCISADSPGDADRPYPGGYDVLWVIPDATGSETEAATSHRLRSEPDDAKQSRLRDYCASGKYSGRAKAGSAR
jgi:hypothetical protein